MMMRDFLWGIGEEGRDVEYVKALFFWNCFAFCGAESRRGIKWVIDMAFLQWVEIHTSYERFWMNKLYQVSIIMTITQMGVLHELTQRQKSFTQRLNPSAFSQNDSFHISASTTYAMLVHGTHNGAIYIPGRGQVEFCTHAIFEVDIKVASRGVGAEYGIDGGVSGEGFLQVVDGGEAVGEGDDLLSHGAYKGVQILISASFKVYCFVIVLVCVVVVEGCGLYGIGPEMFGN
jgi:hypothetical protein